MTDGLWPDISKVDRRPPAASPGLHDRVDQVDVVAKRTHWPSYCQARWRWRATDGEVGAVTAVHVAACRHQLDLSYLDLGACTEVSLTRWPR